jgi:hypothetical protein
LKSVSFFKRKNGLRKTQIKERKNYEPMAIDADLTRKILKRVSLLK